MCFILASNFCGNYIFIWLYKLAQQDPDTWLWHEGTPAVEIIGNIDMIFSITLFPSDHELSVP